LECSDFLFAQIRNHINFKQNKINSGREDIKGYPAILRRPLNMQKVFKETIIQQGNNLVKGESN